MDLLEKMHNPNKKTARCPLCGHIIIHIEGNKYQCKNINCHLDIFDY